MVLHELPIINLAPKLTAVVAWIFVFEKTPATGASRVAYPVRRIVFSVRVFILRNCNCRG
jgi:hypothetical protein